MDNSFGRGHFSLPPKLAGLGRYVENLKPSKLVDHKFFPEDDIHMLVAEADMRLSVMRADMLSLLKHGLVRVQVNDPGTISFYFKGKGRR